VKDRKIESALLEFQLKI